MNVPKDPQARRAKIGGRVGKILVDLGESGSDDLIAQGKVGKSECQDQDCGRAGEGNARPIEHEQVADTEKHAGYGGWKHAQKINGATHRNCPLIDEEGHALGTICVIDRIPREFVPDQQAALKVLSRLVLAQLEFRRNLMLLKEALNDRTKEEHERQRDLIKVQETLLRVMRLRP